jgi:hypothetical protein
MSTIVFDLMKPRNITYNPLKHQGNEKIITAIINITMLIIN